MAIESTPVDFSQSALLLVAHGSPNGSGGHGTTLHHAEMLATLKLFSEVGAGFLTQKPFARNVLNTLEAKKIFIVPNMATNGYVCGEKLPRELGLTGAVTERLTPRGHQHLILTEPVGTHPLMSKILANLVLALMKQYDLASNNTALVVIGHGSTKSRASFSKIQDIVNDLEKFELTELGHHGSIHGAYLEETPSIENWASLTTAKNIIFAPFLISDGFHAHFDIPMDIGFDPGNAEFQKNMAQGCAYKAVINGKNMYYLPPIGAASDVVEVIISRVKQCK